MKGLLDEPNRKQLQVADTFKLEFRIKEMIMIRDG